ncbi:MAG TPA: hypothetical protein VK327_01470, partial [Candidatus Paceibacterota bacterium]|nr:hypothetical protein [Candidatus Paceibacterota bacterium]
MPAKLLRPGGEVKQKPLNTPTYVFSFDIDSTLRHSGCMAKPALGRGLGALLGGAPTTAKPPQQSSPAPTPISTAPAAPIPSVDERERVQRVPLRRIQPCSFQPRKDFP